MAFHGCGLDVRFDIMEYNYNNTTGSLMFVNNREATVFRGESIRGVDWPTGYFNDVSQQALQSETDLFYFARRLITRV